MMSIDTALLKTIRNAIKSGDIVAARRVFDGNSAAINAMTVFGTWLHVAASYGKLEFVKMLVEEYGLDMNTRGGVANGNALHRAATDGHYEVAKYLLEAGAEMDTSEPERNPLFGAILGGHLEIGKLLIENGIDTKIAYTGERMKNMAAIDFARERGAMPFVELLSTT